MAIERVGPGLFDYAIGGREVLILILLIIIIAIIAIYAFTKFLEASTPISTEKFKEDKDKKF